ncbi:MAG: pyruvate formate lyase-activating enzyme 1 [Elusimicrobia bacterium ADurb.Bin231]|nr:MAG: pyruvate formate lyase-activating enzyme 1 [Elusimicrobia bacterium ADurb.Bin231]
MKESLYYKVNDFERESVKCELCPHNCVIASEKTGVCRIRKNIDGKLFSLTYGKFTSIAVDPIEKKPLYHFYPGSKIFSIGTLGCNFRCDFCQNYEISQSEFNERIVRDVSPEYAVSLARENNSIGIAYTYNEPLINYEWLKETAALSAKKGLKNVLVSNGFINETPLYNIIDNIDAANIDVKSFRDDFYKKYCFGRLDPVLRTVEILVKQCKHVEITTLLIPGLNDSDAEINDIADWVSSLNDEIPFHLSGYFPQYRMNIPVTPLDTLKKAQDIASRKLKFVYIGNVPSNETNYTYCPKCKNILIRRNGYETVVSGISEGRCTNCGYHISSIVL